MDNQAECNLLDFIFSLKEKGYYTGISFNTDGIMTISIWFSGDPIKTKMDVWLCLDGTQDASEAIDMIKGEITDRLRNKYEVA